MEASSKGGNDRWLKFIGVSYDDFSELTDVQHAVLMTRREMEEE